ncbi:hypothetical protein OG618_07515 [Kitasatospora sp. NBC_01246]|uniref:hypothetical protein n=1 Tax=Kitasatospora sp. NBC_01246 TaxID=2903570 RepID=UPI002E2F1105|nr:hypothetical protein [Kitasatospora sp. NBC_01246]
MAAHETTAGAVVLHRIGVQAAVLAGLDGAVRAAGPDAVVAAAALRERAAGSGNVFGYGVLYGPELAAAEVARAALGPAGGGVGAGVRPGAGAVRLTGRYGAGARPGSRRRPGNLL